MLNVIKIKFIAKARKSFLKIAFIRIPRNASPEGLIIRFFSGNPAKRYNRLHKTRSYKSYRGNENSAAPLALSTRNLISREVSKQQIPAISHRHSHSRILRQVSTDFLLLSSSFALGEGEEHHRVSLSSATTWSSTARGRRKKKERRGIP